MSEPLIRNDEFRIETRGGSTYAHRVSDGSYLFRTSKEDGEDFLDLLRMAWNSGFSTGCQTQEDKDAKLVEELALEIRRPK